MDYFHPTTELPVKTFSFCFLEKSHVDANIDATKL